MKKEERQYFCNKCCGERNHLPLHKENQKGEYKEVEIHYSYDYYIIKCLGCNNISFLEVYTDSEMIDCTDEGEPYFDSFDEIYPKGLKKEVDLMSKYSTHIPFQIRTIYAETIKAVENEIYILAAVGFRGIIEAICINKKIEGNLKEKIDELEKKYLITNSQKKLLHSIRFSGNEAVHEMKKQSEEVIYLILEIINHIIKGLYINHKIVEGKLTVLIESFNEFKNEFHSSFKKEDIGSIINYENFCLKFKNKLLNPREIKSFIFNLRKEIKEDNHSAYYKYYDEDSFVLNKLPLQSKEW